MPAEFWRGGNKRRKAGRPMWLVAWCPEAKAGLGAGDPGSGPSYACLCDAEVIILSSWLQFPHL